MKVSKFKKNLRDENINIAQLASKAFHIAYENSKKNNLTIIKRDNNELVKIYPDGKREVLKKTKMVKVDKKIFYI